MATRLPQTLRDDMSLGSSHDMSLRPTLQKHAFEAGKNPRCFKGDVTF